MMNNSGTNRSAVATRPAGKLSRLRFRVLLAVSLTGIVMLGLAGLSDAAASEQPIQSELTSIPFKGLVDINGAALTDAAGIGEGQWTLVMIWATNCHICQEQKPLISAFHNAHKDTDAKVFGIALDGEANIEAVRKYMEKYDVAFPTYIGDFGDVAGSYQQMTEENFRGTPTYLLFDPSGELKGNNPGPISVDAVESFMARFSQ